ncbi:MAG: type II secretion system F family protein [Abitibacteriaceae bacterium]|nr:type II secretion system F family protein [Abditibacteriaceae bacterium]
MITASLFVGLIVFIIMSFRGLMFFGLLMGIGCLFFPWFYVKSVRARYYRKFDEQLAETLLLMANSLKAGFSFLQSMEMVAREAPSPISEEFQRVTQEISIGISVNEALNNLAARVNSMDLQLMVIAVIIQREVGSSLAEILETIAGVIRERVTIRGEIRVLTTQGRFTGFLLGALPIGLGLMLHLTSKFTMPNDPSFVEPLVTTLMGRDMLAVAMVFQVLGFISIFRIVSIKV